MPSITSWTSQETSVIFHKVQQVLDRDWWISIHFACFCFWMTIMITIDGSIKCNCKFGFKLQSSHVIEKCYLRNRKHVPCFYRVIETRVQVWENEKCCGNTSRRRVFPQLLRVLPNFHECFYNSIETRRTSFLFLLENTATKKTKTTNKFSLLAPSLRQQRVLVLCFYRVIEIRFLTNQCAYFLLLLSLVLTVVMLNLFFSEDVEQSFSKGISGSSQINRPVVFLLLLSVVAWFL